jgi:hypothetical protein
MPTGLVALFAFIVVYEVTVGLGPLYLGRGRHRQLSPAARLRHMRASRVHGIRVHQPIPPHLLACDDALIDAAAAQARRDGVALLADLAATQGRAA